MEVKIKHPDLVYIDPPYYSPLSDNEYVRRYHLSSWHEIGKVSKYRKIQ